MIFYTVDVFEDHVSAKMQHLVCIEVTGQVCIILHTFSV